MTGWLLDNLPWWVWLAAAGVILAATFTLWRPLWALLPSPVRAGIIAAFVGTLAYLAGRNRGAKGALNRAEQKEQANADDIRARGDQARARADRHAGDGGLFEDDGFRRKDR